MKQKAKKISALFLAVVLAGCAIERHYSLIPEKNQVIQVSSGDRWFIDLDESDGCVWSSTCDDDDVEVIIDHPTETANKANVTIRVHRGYDGPSSVEFQLKHPSKKKPLKTFTVNLYRRTGDCAFWNRL